ncbi:DUF1801 domain-containing protein [Pararhodobacter oceanensis]|uniref:YdhG-like domain-containing protein n=1 Tax=Pararhodobacter oceanensis TaxID=2172121 RepID=A0A2T8HS04_9RHOB|nr:DUF1801 domain-containing protein [Pararhodobacter oceanensis]PVH28216.1 hypothetical protein DDE20_14015 [Pararhodobacter oceanensis]
MAGNKTTAHDADVGAFIAAVEKPQRRADAEVLDALFRRVTGFAPRMWGPTIIGYGRYHYRYESGREGDFLATGFSPRAAHQVIYIMPGYGEYQAIMDRLGKHKLGKSCLYINKLADVDLGVLEEFIRQGLADLGRRYPVHPA